MKQKKRNHPQSISWGRILIIIGVAILAVIALYVLLFRIESTAYCANSKSCATNLTGDFLPNAHSTYFGQPVSLPPSLANIRSSPRVLGASSEPKHIVVDLSTQKVTAYEGTTPVMTYPVATGRWHPTPTGDFRIWVKLRYTHMEGGSQADGTYYNLYNVPYTMFFYNAEVPKALGFSLHGAYWHNNFGHPMSHGCVNMRPEDAGKLFDWADPVSTEKITYATADHPGTLVTITGTTPDE